VVSASFPGVIRAEGEKPAIGALRRPARSGRLEGEWDCRNRCGKDQT